MGRDNRRNEVERLARLMPAGPLRRHLAFLRRRKPEHFLQCGIEPLRSM